MGSSHSFSNHCHDGPPESSVASLMCITQVNPLTAQSRYSGPSGTAYRGLQAKLEVWLKDVEDSRSLRRVASRRGL